MAHQITLSDDEYTALAAAAEKAGTSVEALVHEALSERLSKRAPDPLAEYMRRVGHLLEQSSSSASAENELEEEAELERLANSVAPGKMASNMVIEDRGTR